MLSKKFRLVADRDFAKLFAKGKSVSGKGIGLKFSKNQIGNPRFAFVVSTKVSKRAVIRNTIKRRMREAVRAEVKNLTIEGHDLVFMARSEAIKMTYHEITDTIRFLLDKSGITTRKPGAV